jgi:hypothetical protein
VTAEYRIHEGQSGVFGKARTRLSQRRLFQPSIDEQIALAAELRAIEAAVRQLGKIAPYLTVAAIFMLATGAQRWPGVWVGGTLHLVARAGSRPSRAIAPTSAPRATGSAPAEVEPRPLPEIDRA